MRFFGLFMTLGFIAMFPFSILAPWAAKHIGKRNIILAGCVLGLCGHGMIIAAPHATSMLLAGSVLSGCASAGLISVLFAMMGDIGDFVERRDGVHAHGVVSSAVALGYKLGLGVGAALVGWLLAMGGYVSNMETQSDAALAAISASFAWAPALTVAACIPLLLFYRLDNAAGGL